MYLLERDKDTVCAISTAPGVGGIAVLRVSGDQAAEITRHLCAFLPKSPESHRVYYGLAKDPVSQEPIDEVLVTFFAKGRSFTGEQTTEISCHGGAFISSQLLDKLVESGARLAERGEFTYRAFMNGRIDLVQAESVLDLIESQSKKAARLALRQLNGEFSSVLSRLEDDITWVLAHLEANIDFAAEDIEVISPKVLAERTNSVLERINGLLASHKKGRMIREGIQVALVGRPNAGKSSLLNAIVQEERAIVTEVPGTTRDFVEGHALINGTRVTFLDTAGLRSTEDKVEVIGIQRTEQLLDQVDVVLYLLDQSQEIHDDDIKAMGKLIGKEWLVVGNKSDCQSWDFSKPAVVQRVRELAGNSNALVNELERLDEARFVSLSAKNHKGVSDLIGWLSDLTNQESAEVSTTLSNTRHFELLEKMQVSVEKALGLMNADESPEFIAFELQEGILSLHEILGKQFDDQVMDRVFKEFCLGK